MCIKIIKIKIFDPKICANSLENKDFPIFVQTLIRNFYYLFMDVGAADKAAIQLVEVQPYQLLVSDT